MSNTSKVFSEIKAHPVKGILLLVLTLVSELYRHDVLSWADEKLKESVGTPVAMMPLKLARFLAAWSTAHPVELFLVFVAVYLLWVAVPIQIQWRRAVATIPANKIDEIRFDYLPDSPLNHGWVIAYPKEQEAEARWKSTRWSPALDGPVAGSLHMDVEPGCAIETVLDPNKQQADWLAYVAKHTSETMIFTYVRLRQKDGSQAHKWIKHTVGAGKTHPTPKWEEAEWTFYIKGIPMEGGWRQFNVSLPQSVNDTWGYYGWSFDCLLRIRLRGKLSISPLEFYES